MRGILEYAAYRALAFAVPLLPRPLLVWLGHRLGAIYYLLSPRSRRTGLENLRRVLPERTDHRRILRASLQLQAVALLDALWATRVTAERVRRYVDWDEAELDALQARVAEGNGGAVATAHFGSWEMLNIAAGAIGFPPATFIARPVRNARIDRHLRRERERRGNTLVYREQAMQACVAALRRREVVCSVIDIAIVPKEGAAFVDFLGTPAATSLALPYLALQCRVPLFFIICRPVDGGRRYRIEGEAIPARSDGMARQEILRLALELNRALERAVRRQPEAWIWSYKRWKWRPSELAGPYPSYSLWAAKHA